MPAAQALLHFQGTAPKSKGIKRVYLVVIILEKGPGCRSRLMLSLAELTEHKYPCAVKAAPTEDAADCEDAVDGAAGPASDAAAVAEEFVELVKESDRPCDDRGAPLFAVDCEMVPRSHAFLMAVCYRHWPRAHTGCRAGGGWTSRPGLSCEASSSHSRL
jgi:hypothetical protein